MEDFTKVASVIVNSIKEAIDNNTISDYPVLEVRVRSDWEPLYSDSGLTPAEYYILLSTGGPAWRIRGDLEGCYPVSARLERCDWFEPWQEIPLSNAAKKSLLEFARWFFER